MLAVITNRVCEATYKQRALAERFVAEWQPSLNDELRIVDVYDSDTPETFAARAGLSPDIPAVRTAVRRAQNGWTGALK